MLLLRKTNETIWKPPFLREFRLSTNSPISEQFFHDPPLCPNFKSKQFQKGGGGGGGGL